MRGARGEAHAFCRVFAAVTMGSTFERGDGGSAAAASGAAASSSSSPSGMSMRGGPTRGPVAVSGTGAAAASLPSCWWVIHDVDGEAHRDEAGGEGADERRDSEKEIRLYGKKVAARRIPARSSP